MIIHRNVELSRCALIVLILVLSALPVFADGPAWVAELTEVQRITRTIAEPLHAEAINIWLPAGEYATVGVYDTQTADAQPPDGVQADVWIIWYEHRTLFAGRSEEREEAVAFHLSPPRYHEPTGSFAVRLHAEKPGEYVVPIECSTNTVTVTLHVVEPVPESDVGFGFYTDWGRYAYPEHERLYFRHMAEYGCNTFTPYGLTAKNAAIIARQIDAAIEEGLLDERFPLLCLSVGKTELDEAKELGQHTEQWPELIGYNWDEPGATEETARGVAAESEAWHEAGYRTGTALSANSAFLFGELLDIWILHMDTVSKYIRRHAKNLGAEFWMYNCTARGTNAPLHRYYNGIYTFAVRPRVNLMWAYMHDAKSRINKDGTWWYNGCCEHALLTPDGPISTVGLEGYRDGTVDYRVLRELERLIEANPKHKVTPEAAAWLQDLVDRVDTRFWPGGRHADDYSDYPWDGRDTVVPPITDFSEMRRQALGYLAQIGGGFEELNE